MKKITLGGDRLGSGKKMQVDIDGYPRSTHDLGNIFRTTMSPGTLVPFMVKVALPGDTWDINLDCDVKTHPTVGPLFGSFKVQLDVFSCPIRLYNALLHNNKLSIGLNMDQVKLPQLVLYGGQWVGGINQDSAQINPSSLLAYIGIRGVGIDDTGNMATRIKNGTALLCYWDVYKNYYANKQEKIGAWINAAPTGLVESIDRMFVTLEGVEHDISEIPPPGTTTPPIMMNTVLTIEYLDPPGLPDPNTIFVNVGSYGLVQLNQLVKTINYGTGNTIYGMIWNQYVGETIAGWMYQTTNYPVITQPRVDTFPLENIDKMREEILATQSTTEPFYINVAAAGEPYTRYGYIDIAAGNRRVDTYAQQGLGVKTYQSDLYHNWLNTTDFLAITNKSRVSTIGNNFSMDTLNIAQKVYDYQNRVFAGDGTYDTWLELTWGAEQFGKPEIPVYLGGLIKELVFQEVVSNSAGTEQEPLGTLAGKGVLSKKHKGGKIVHKVKEPSYLIGIVSITPRIDYSQGNSWDSDLLTLDDLHKPAFDQIGFQDSINERRAWWTTEYDAGSDTWVKTSSGVIPAWLDYQTDVNQTYGNFALEDNEMFMTLNRRYRGNGTGLITNVSTYINPAAYNNIFADTSLDAMNFWVQIARDSIVRRVMSAKIMPNL